MTPLYSITDAYYTLRYKLGLTQQASVRRGLRASVPSLFTVSLAESEASAFLPNRVCVSTVLMQMFLNQSSAWVYETLLVGGGSDVGESVYRPHRTFTMSPASTRRLSSFLTDVGCPSIAETSSPVVFSPLARREKI